MSTNKEWKFLSVGVQKRAARIDDSVWAEHKDDILREFRNGGYEHMVPWMEHNRGFQATIPQYRRKIYGAWVEDRSHPTSSSLNEQPANGGSPETHEATGGEAPATSLDRDQGVQPRASVEFGGSCDTQDACNCEEEDRTGCTSHKRKSCVCQLSAESTVKRQKAATDSSTSSDTAMFEPSSRQSSSSAADTTTARGSPTWQTEDEILESPGNRTTEQPDQAGLSRSQPQPAFHEGDNAGSRELPHEDEPSDDQTFIIDFGSSDPLCSADNVDLIKRAADAFSCLSHSEEAFELYLSISQFWQNKDPRKERLALVACARSASKAEQSNIIRERLANMLPPRACNTLTQSERFERININMLLADLHCRQNDLISAKVHVERAFLSYAYAKGVQFEKVKFDFVTYSNIYNCLKQSFVDDDIDLEIYQQDLGEMDELFSFGLLGGSSQSDLEIGPPYVVQTFWKWCIDRLNKASPSLSLYKDLFHSCKDSREVALASVFCCLWHGWVHQQDLPSSLSSCDLESTFGIPVEELLTIFSMMMTKTATQKHVAKTCASRYGLDGGWIILKEASTTASSLLALPEGTLFKQVLDVFLQYNDLKRPLSAKKHYCAIPLRSTRKFVEKVLGLTVKGYSTSHNPASPLSQTRSSQTEDAAVGINRQSQLSVDRLSTLQAQLQNADNSVSSSHASVERALSMMSLGCDPPLYKNPMSCWSTAASMLSCANRIRAARQGSIRSSTSIQPSHFWHLLAGPVQDQDQVWDALSEGISSMVLMEQGI